MGFSQIETGKEALLEKDFLPGPVSRLTVSASRNYIEGGQMRSTSDPDNSKSQESTYNSFLTQNLFPKVLRFFYNNSI
jgi:hypothetical protein